MPQHLTYRKAGLMISSTAEKVESDFSTPSVKGTEHLLGVITKFRAPWGAQRHPFGQYLKIFPYLYSLFFLCSQLVSIFAHHDINMQ